MLNYDYDRLLGIMECLEGGLDGLNRLAKDRREASYGRNESLHEFIVLGAFTLDRCGNFSKITEVWSDDYRKKHASLSEIMDIPSVIGMEDFWNSSLRHGTTLRDSKVSISSSYGHCLPSTKIVCQGCGQHWRLDNVADCAVSRDSRTESLQSHVGKTLKEVHALYTTRSDGDWCVHPEIVLRNDRWIDLSPVPDFETLKMNERGWVGKQGSERRKGIPSIDTETYVIQDGDEGSWDVWVYHHEECLRRVSVEASLKKFSEVFEKAGYRKWASRQIENRYNRNPCSPWLEVETEVGMIRIGWRKRVIHIDWDTTGADLLHVFAGEEVTKGSDYVHAWGYDKAIEYLRLIRENLATAMEKK